MAGEIMISAGEASGDAHGAALALALQALAPGLTCFGLGGARMAAAGVELLARSEEVAVTGLAEVVPVLGRILATLGRLKAALRRRRPRALILIDFPDFNFILGRAARKAGVPVIYYVVPQIWAWRQGRVRFLRENVARLIVILPFEAEWYRERGLRADYAGHPLADQPDLPPGHRERFLAGLGLDPARPALALLPGSRRNEVGRHWPLLAEAARLLQASRPELQLILPLAPGRSQADLPGAAGLPLTLLPGRAREALAASRAALVCSGTATLEAALALTPHVVFYRLSPATYFFRHFVRIIDTYSLPNLIAGRRIVTELIQEQATPARLAAEVLDLLDEGPRRAGMLSGLAEVKARVGSPGGATRAARLVLEVLEQTRRAA